MRKSLIITLLLLCLSLGGVYAAHAGVNIKKDFVVLDETVLYGDKAAVEGLMANVATQCSNHLFWDTVYRVGEMPQINTKFRFSQKEEYRQRERQYFGISLGISESGGFSASAGIDLENDRHFGGSYFYSMKDLYKDVASRTKAGQTHKERVYLKDYYDFYPLVASIDLPDYQWDMNWEPDEPEQAPGDGGKPLIQMIRDYFRIPVIDDHRLEVTITKDDKGLITEIDVSSLDNSGASMWTIGTVAEDACYFTFNNRTDDGESLDTSLIPGGYGIYRLPFTKTKGKSAARIFPEEMEMIYALDQQVQIEGLTLTEDKSRLLLLTRENGAYHLTVLDAGTAQELQKLKIIDCGEDVYLWPFYSDGFITAFSSDGRLTVIEAADSGKYQSVFTVDTPESKPGVLGMPLTSNAAMGWDGERLAVAEPQLAEIDYSRYEKCGFHLSVYDKSGLLFAGKYDSSLDINWMQGSLYNCRPLEPNPISLRWSQGD